MANKVLSPSQAVQQYLLEDVCGSHKELREFGGRWDFGTGRIDLKEIQANCIECSCYDKSRVRNCHIPECPLYPFRLGMNPNRKGIGNHQLNKQIMKKVSSPYKTIA